MKYLALPIALLVLGICLWPKPSVAFEYGSGNYGDCVYGGELGNDALTFRVNASASPPVSGYEAWYDASDTATITESSGLVSQWDDKSANGNDIVQSTGSNQPTTGSRTYNGLNVIDFDGNDFLNKASGFPSSQPYTAFAVVAKDNSSQTIILSTDSHASPPNNLLIVRSGSSPFAPGVNMGSLVQGTSEAGTSAHVIGTIANGASSLVSIDGMVFSGNAGSNSGDGSLTVGANTIVPANAIDGFIGEVIIYTAALSTTDRQAVEAYLSQKWFGIGNSLVTLSPNVSTSATSVGTATFDVELGCSDFGYAVTINGSSLTNGSHTLANLTSPTASVIGTEQYGINLVANTVPSVGVGPSGGIGQAASGYDTTNQFKYVSGNTIAEAITYSTTTTYTISFIANASLATPATNYSTIHTLICTATF